MVPPQEIHTVPIIHLHAHLCDHFLLVSELEKCAKLSLKSLVQFGTNILNNFEPRPSCLFLRDMVTYIVYYSQGFLLNQSSYISSLFINVAISSKLVEILGLNLEHR